MTLVFAAKGILAILTEHFFGTVRRNSGTIELDSTSAILAGVGLLILGLFPLGIWAKTGKSAAWWSASCIVVGLAVFFSSALFR